MSANSGSSWTTGLIGAAFLIVGLGVALFLGLPTLERARASTQWPEAPGQITVSSIRTQVNKGKRTYWAEVDYEYTVNGSQHTGNTVSFGAARNSNRQLVEKVVDRYPLGHAVKVHYDPEAPEVSVLEPGVTFGAYFGLILGGVFSVIGVWLVGAFLLKRLRGDAEAAPDAVSVDATP